MTSALLACAIVLVLGVHLYRHVRNADAVAAASLAADAASIGAVVPGATRAGSDAAGVVTWNGSWNGQRVQVRTIVDTLATRKLPACWLSVTVIEPVAVPATVDVMMRPGSATTFSNFDHLPHTVPAPAGFPDGAVVRGDRAGKPLPLDLLSGHLGIFANGRAKELLVTPNGVRFVWLLAEADRARYGVFRQAEFAGRRIDPALVEDLLGRASALRAALNVASMKVAA